MTSPDETSTRKRSDLHAPLETTCSNCGGKMKLRRRADFHFCSKAECAAAKSKHHYQRRAMQAKESMRFEIVALVSVLATQSRVLCPRCGLITALPGYVHPDPQGHICEGVGTAIFSVKGVGAAIWPDTERRYQELE